MLELDSKLVLELDLVFNLNFDFDFDNDLVFNLSEFEFDEASLAADGTVEHVYTASSNISNGCVLRNSDDLRVVASKYTSEGLSIK